MTTLLEILGLEVPEETANFTPHVVKGTVTARNANAALVTFRHQGKEIQGLLPLAGQILDSAPTVGSSLTAVLLEPVTSNAQPILSLVRRELVGEILSAVCPEVRRGDVRLMGLARKPGYRTKVAVAATVEGIDPVAACIGRKSNRVNAVREALGGEQVDIVAWHPDKEIYLRNALQPATVSKVVVDTDTGTAVAHTAAHQMSVAVGSRGLNSALAGRLTKLMVRVVPATPTADA